MELNFLWMICTILSISFGVIGLQGIFKKIVFAHIKKLLKIFIFHLVLDCSLSRFMTWVVNSLQAWSYFSSSLGFFKKMKSLSRNKSKQGFFRFTWW